MSGERQRTPRATITSTVTQPRAGAPRVSTSPNEGTQTALRALLRLESAIRKVNDPTELAFLLANEMRALTRARQVFVMQAADRGAPRTLAISGLATVDRNGALVLSIEQGLERLAERDSLARRHEFRLSSIARPGDSASASYPLQELLWLPMTARDGHLHGGCLLAREIPWTEGDAAIGGHIAAAGAYAWQAVSQKGRGQSRRLHISRPALAAGALAALLLFLLPVSMTVLAPAEIVDRDPFVVASGLQGEIAEVLVSSNASVKTGDVVVRLSQVELRNKLAVAEREVGVAAAKLQKSNQLAFGDIRGRHEMALARAELEVRTAERNYARDQLAKTELKAGRDGVAVLGDRKELIGRPVGIGDRIMEIADPAAIEVNIDVPVSDAIVIKPGARVKVFLDIDPLRPVEATVVRADYQARPRDATSLAYRVTAKLADNASAPPRLGVRGVAQVYGDTVQLWFYLFRRPLSSLRQWTGI